MRIRLAAHFPRARDAPHQIVRSVASLRGFVAVCALVWRLLHHGLVEHLLVALRRYYATSALRAVFLMEVCVCLV